MPIETENIFIKASMYVTNCYPFFANPFGTGKMTTNKTTENRCNTISYIFCILYMRTKCMFIVEHFTDDTYH